MSSAWSITLLQIEWEWKCYYCNIMYLYCNVFPPVNETWGNLSALHSTLHKHRLSLCRWLASGLPDYVHVFWRRRGFGEWFAGRVGFYAFTASLLLLTSTKSPTIPRTSLTQWVFPLSARASILSGKKGTSVVHATSTCLLMPSD